MKMEIKKLLGSRKRMLVIGAVAAVTVTGVLGTVAYMTANLGAASNVFSPQKIVNIGVVEEKDGKQTVSEEGETNEYMTLTREQGESNPVTKKVWIKNLDVPKDRTTDVYIRVAIVPIARTVDKETGSLTQIGTGEDVSNIGILIGQDTTQIKGSWMKGSDGYYYFTEPVKPGDMTDQLLEGVFYKDTSEHGSFINDGKLEIQILADAVAANQNSVKEAWKDAVSVGIEGTLTVK